LQTFFFPSSSSASLIFGSFVVIVFLFFFSWQPDPQQTLAILDKLDIETEKPTEEEIARKFGYEEDYIAGRLSKH